MAAGGYVESQQHHASYEVTRKVFAHAAGVRADQVELQFGELVGRYPHLGEYPETGVDAVVGLVIF